MQNLKLDEAAEALRAKGMDTEAMRRYVINTIALIDDKDLRIAMLEYFVIILDNEIVKLKQAAGYEYLWQAVSDHADNTNATNTK